MLEGLFFVKNYYLFSIVLDYGLSYFFVNNCFLDFFGVIYEYFFIVCVKYYCLDFYVVFKRSVEWLKYFNIEVKGVIYNLVFESLGFDFVGMVYFEKFVDDIFIIYVGRIIKEKGIELFLEVFLML